MSVCVVFLGEEWCRVIHCGGVIGCVAVQSAYDRLWKRPNYCKNTEYEEE